MRFVDPVEARFARGRGERCFARDEMPVDPQAIGRIDLDTQGVRIVTAIGCGVGR